MIGFQVRCVGFGGCVVDVDFLSSDLRRWLIGKEKVVGVYLVISTV